MSHPSITCKTEFTLIHYIYPSNQEEHRVSNITTDKSELQKLLLGITKTLFILASLLIKFPF